MIYKYSLLIPSLFLLTACTTQPAATNTQTPAAATSSSSYTLADVSKHATRTDCWTAINGQVYDLTSYIASGQHKPVIVDGCGKDATSMFAAIDKHAGAAAQNKLASLKIGSLAQ